MSARRYVEVAGTQYNKKGFGAKWSEIVGSYEPGITVSRSHRAFLVDVLKRIPRFAKIFKRGRVTFKVVQRVFNGKRVKGVVIVTPNSSYEVWVGKEAVVKEMFPRTTLPDPGKENRRNVLRALRGVIEPQIQQYRGRFKGQSVIKSSLSGKPIFGPYHVDHVYPFVRIVEEWCRDRGYDLERIPVKCVGTVCRLVDATVAEDFFDYHALHAEYQVLDASENVSKGARYFGREKFIKDP